MSTHSVSHVKAHLAEVIEATRRTGDPVLITQNGEGTAVMQDLASYEATRRTLLMLKLVAQGERDLAQGRSVTQGAVFRALKKRLAGR
jgi:prevent-host-death family protein